MSSIHLSLDVVASDEVTSVACVVSFVVVLSVIAPSPVSVFVLQHPVNNTRKDIPTSTLIVLFAFIIEYLLDKIITFL
ncbi:MAG: hypothetical protein WCL18_06190 [bacterium]